MLEETPQHLPTGLSYVANLVVVADQFPELSPEADGIRGMADWFYSTES